MKQPTQVKQARKLTKAYTHLAILQSFLSF